MIAVTRGTIDTLNRDELQGVIAHEFSHILNGDMRLNMRLIGMLNGILLIAMIGYFLMRSGSPYRRISPIRPTNKKGGNPLPLLGLLLVHHRLHRHFFRSLDQKRRFAAARVSGRRFGRAVHPLARRHRRRA